MERYEDPNDPLNGPEFHTGKKCAVKGCSNRAGTSWSPFFCQPCNANRFNRITANLEKEIAYREGKSSS